jgi:hypothetical protein
MSNNIDAPIDRSTQIELMKSAKERHDAYVARWKAEALLKEAVEALKPFAKETCTWRSGSITVGDARRARAALAKIKEQSSYIKEAKDNG